MTSGDRGAGLESVKFISSASVYKGDRLAATLRRNSAGVEFRYDEAYLSQAGPPVATTLPLGDQPVVTPAGAVPAFFAGLLPEGRRLTSLRAAVKTSADDELSLLLAVGSDPVGDVRILPAGADPVGAAPLVQVQKSFAEIKFTDILEAAGIVDPVALAGVQNKASAAMLSLPVTKAGKRYILKVDPPEFPHLVENEAYFLELARRARFPVVGADVVLDSSGRPGLLVERFDRVTTPDGRAASRAVEDAAQAMGVYPADKYTVTAERAVGALVRLCPSRAVASRDLFKQFCYAWLTGNGDLHAKNISVVAVDGEWRVAPAYDIPSTLPYGDQTMALRMGGRTEGLSRRRLLEFAAVVGLHEKTAVRVLDEVLGVTEKVIEEWSQNARAFTRPRNGAVLDQLRFRRRRALADPDLRG